MLDLSKPMQDDMGAKYVLLSTFSAYKDCAIIQNTDNGQIFALLPNGTAYFLARRQQEYGISITNFPQEHYINLYEDNSVDGPYNSRKEADNKIKATLMRIGCIKITGTLNRYDD